MTRGRLRPLLSGVVLRSQSDARLAQLAGEGHQIAFTTIFERYQRELDGHAARIVGRGRAEDVVQHAMLNAWSELLSGGTVAEPRAWLHRIVHNLALNTVARRGYDDAEIPETVASALLTHEIAEHRLSAADALAAIAALPDAQRRALALTALEGRSGADAAAEMGISESAMRQLVYRARNGLRSTVTAITPLPFVMSALQPVGAGSAAAIGGASAVSGLAAKSAVVLVVAAGGAGATTVLSHHSGRGAHRAASVERVRRAPSQSLAAAAAGHATYAVARRAKHRHSDGSQGGHGQHGASATQGDHGESNTSDETSNGTSNWSPAAQGAGGRNTEGSDSTSQGEQRSASGSEDIAQPLIAQAASQRDESGESNADVADDGNVPTRESQ